MSMYAGYGERESAGQSLELTWTFVAVRERERDFINQVSTSASSQQSLKWRTASGGNRPSMLAAHNNQHIIFKIMTEKNL